MHPVVQSFTRSFALFSAVFITVITTKVRGQQNCNTAFMQCARPLSVLTDSGLSFVTTKEDLDRTCPNFQEALRCIRAYTRRCMSYDQRKHFKKLFHGTTLMVHELCKNGTYQEEYLTYAPCMKNVESQTKGCFSKYATAMQDIQTKTNLEEEREVIMDTDIFMYEKRKRETADKGIRDVCCNFQEYVECSSSTMRQHCGEGAEKFSRKFLDQMSSAMIKSHCNEYTPKVCGIETSSASRSSSISMVISLLITLSHFLR
ncbi:uncharacterized protein LOC123682979 [Harmonia axyridis]|uniref:uncharacterized protein LOC123682979 n=1 Tax=Harmonia axyridis TaxID=115357 RepID=UPI001E276337|nr:uncharacterized protein LOC123682979 [Harmonia axyridis]